MINWSYILKYLLGSASKLRRQVTDEKTHTTTHLLHHNHTPSSHGDNNINSNINNGIHGGVELPMSLPAGLISVNNNINNNRDSNSRDTPKQRVDEESYYDSQEHSAVSQNAASLVPPGRPRSSSRNRERGDNLGNSLNTSLNNNNLNDQAQEQLQQQARPMRQPSPQPTRGNMNTSNYSTSRGSANHSATLGAGLQMQYQHLPPSTSPLYSSVDDSDLSVGSTVHSQNTQLSLSHPNHVNNTYTGGSYGANPTEMSTFRSSVPTFQPASNNRQGYQSSVSNYPTPQPPVQQQQQSPYTALPGQGYREPPSSTRSVRSTSNSAAGHGATISVVSGNSQRSSRSREDFDHPTSTPIPSVSKQRASSAAPHSQFAQEVIQDLGVDSSQASAAMSVIDKVTMITDEQLAQLDSATRAQILQIRRELGIASASAGASSSSNANSGTVRRATPGPASVPKRGDNHSHLPPPGVRNMQYYAQSAQSVPKRANSAPRQRSLSGGSASLLSQQSQGSPSMAPGYNQNGVQQRSDSNSRGRASPSPMLDHNMQNNGMYGNNNNNSNSYGIHTPQQLADVFSPYAAPHSGNDSRNGNHSSASNRHFDAFSPPQQRQHQYNHQQYYNEEEDDNFSQLDML